MKHTHLETLFDVLGPDASRLKIAFEALKLMDLDSKFSVDEYVFDRVFPADRCSELFRTPGTDRSSRFQRKMDLSLLKHTYHLWKDKNYFDITPTLTEKLKATDLRDVDTFFLRSPYRSMYLSLPKGNGLKILTPQSNLHEVDSIYLIINDYGSPQNVAIRSNDNIINGITKDLTMLVCGETKRIFGDTIMFFDLLFWEGKISDSIFRNKDILSVSSLWPYIVEIFNFVVKVLLYINCANVSIRNEAGLDLEAKLQGLKNQGKKRKLLQKYEKLSPQPHKVLDVVINHGDSSLRQAKGVCHQIGPKSLERVRGHFKTQRFGKDRSESKIIWIEPYVRGEGTEFYKDKRNYKIL